MRKYIIIDHGATFMHTHHGNLVSGYAKLLESKNCDYVVFLPLGSEIEIKVANQNIKKNLLPSYHPMAFNFKVIKSYLPALLNQIYRLTKDNSYYKITSNVISFLIVRTTIKQIIRTKFSYDKCVIVFPTACPISLLIGLELNKKKINVEIIYRLTNTAERRNYFSSMINLNEIIHQLSQCKNIKVKLCYETIEYALTFGNYKDNFEYLPPPPRVVEQFSRIESHIVVISMLGIAQNHKNRIKAVNEILQQDLLFKEFDLNWIIQISDLDQESINFNSRGMQIQFLSGIIDEDLMKKTLINSSILVLFYDVNFYRTNASAMAYRAADYLLPIVTYTGSAFANEIDQFNLGVVITEVIELKSAIHNIVTNYAQFQNNIRNYNELRQNLNSTTLNFNK